MFLLFAIILQEQQLRECLFVVVKRKIKQNEKQFRCMCHPCETMFHFTQPVFSLTSICLSLKTPNSTGCCQIVCTVKLSSGTLPADFSSVILSLSSLPSGVWQSIILRQNCLSSHLSLLPSCWSWTSDEEFSFFLPLLPNTEYLHDYSWSMQLAWWGMIKIIMASENLLRSEMLFNWYLLKIFKFCY